MNKTALTLASIVAAFGISAGAATAASAKPAELCTGKRFNVTYNGQTINGTCGNDTIFVYNHTNVTINAGGGNDDIRAGWGGGFITVHGGEGNDSVSNGGDKLVIAYGEGGNDTLEGGSFAGDQLYGGTGTDTGYVGFGDAFSSLETVWAN